MAPSPGFESVVSLASIDPTRVGVFSDLDGTLSYLIADPDAVTPVSGAVEIVTELAGKVGRVAIVSGRPVSFLERFFDPPVELSGLYGIEHRSGDVRRVDATAVQWMPTIASVAREGAERFGESLIEDKIYSLTVHYRGESPERAAEIEKWSAEIAASKGLHARSAKMSVEVHPPISRNKGDAIEDMLGGLDAAVYFGDDIGDRSAFERLIAARDNGTLKASAAVLVNGVETPNELVEAATDVVSTPQDVLAMLQKLNDAAVRTQAPGPIG